jgi:hypothetical protein
MKRIEAMMGMILRTETMESVHLTRMSRLDNGGGLSLAFLS